MASAKRFPVRPTDPGSTTHTSHYLRCQGPGHIVPTDHATTTPLGCGSADDTCDVGYEGGALVAEDYGPHDNAFSGEVNWVQIDLGEEAKDADHLITPEERLRIAMARQ
jgi:hypothetical protein